MKNENFQQKIFDIFLIFAQNIDCGYILEPPRRGGSNEYPQYMFWSKNEKNGFNPLQSPVLLYKTGVHGGKHYTDMFSWCKNRKTRDCCISRGFQRVFGCIALPVIMLCNNILVLVRLLTFWSIITLKYHELLWILSQNNVRRLVRIKGPLGR